jgi:hypothetical protein
MNWKVTNWSTPWNRILLEKLVDKFSAFYGTQRLIATLIRAGPPVPSLRQPNPVHALPPFHFLKIHFIIALPSTPRSCKSTLCLKCQTKSLCAIFLPSTCHMPCPHNFSLFHRAVCCHNIRTILYMFFIFNAVCGYHIFCVCVWLFCVCVCVCVYDYFTQFVLRYIHLSTTCFSAVALLCGRVITVVHIRYLPEYKIT